MASYFVYRTFWVYRGDASGNYYYLMKDRGKHPRRLTLLYKIRYHGVAL